MGRRRKKVVEMTMMTSARSRRESCSSQILEKILRTHILGKKDGRDRRRRRESDWSGSKKVEKQEKVFVELENAFLRIIICDGTGKTYNTKQCHEGDEDNRNEDGKKKYSPSIHPPDLPSLSSCSFATSPFHPFHPRHHSFPIIFSFHVLFVRFNLHFLSKNHVQMFHRSSSFLYTQTYHQICNISPSSFVFWLFTNLCSTTFVCSHFRELSILFSSNDWRHASLRMFNVHINSCPTALLSFLPSFPLK